MLYLPLTNDTTFYTRFIPTGNNNFIDETSYNRTCDYTTSYNVPVITTSKPFNNCIYYNDRSLFNVRLTRVYDTPSTILDGYYWTICAWFKHLAYSGNQEHKIFCSTADGYYITIMIDSSNRVSYILVYAYFASIYYFCQLYPSFTITLSTTKFHLLGISREYNNVYFYLDGVYLGYMDTMFNNTIVSGTFTIGSQNGNNYTLYGYISNIATYSTSKSKLFHKLVYANAVGKLY